MLKRAILFAATLGAALLCLTAVANAQPVGRIGFWGGITEGTRLPKTTEVILAQAANAKKNAQTTLAYKELVFLAGVPVECEGAMTLKTTGEPAGAIGSYKATYVIAAKSADGASAIARNITFNVNYRKDGNQIVYDYEAASWTETITAGGKTFRLNPALSHFSVSILTDNTPGVSYFRGDVSQKSVYADGGTGTTLEASGSLYGYDSPWSNTETMRLDATVSTLDWQEVYQIRPSVSVSKSLQYTQNEPTAISFDGNYKEVMSNQSGLRYDIYTLPQRFIGAETSGGTTISVYNTFEQLIAPDAAWLKGNPAETDIKKLFAMKILEGDTRAYVPSQAATRAQFVTMLTKAVKLPLETPAKTTGAKKAAPVPVNIVFPDVKPERPDYAYILAAFKAGVAIGRGNGLFYADEAINREEAVFMMIRALGLSNLGPDPTPQTAFADDKDISAWAKREIYAANRIGLIAPDCYGNLKPQAKLTKAEAAALINALIDYCRYGVSLDYTEHIVNYPD